MLRKILPLSTVPCGILPFSLFGESDIVAKDSETVKSVLEESKTLRKETGRERLYYMFSKDEFGDISPELNSSLQVGFLGAFFGAMYGGINQSKIAYLDFIDNNQATAFRSHLEAKKKLQDQVTVNFARGAFKWGWRLGFFSTSYVLITTTVSVYRGKTSIIEYIAGGGITGLLFKLSLGPRGMLVGGLLGATLGCVAGCASIGLLKLGGITMEDVRYWQYRFHDERRGKFREAIKEHKAKDDLDIVKEYNKRTQNQKISLDVDNVEK